MNGPKSKTGNPCKIEGCAGLVHTWAGALCKACNLARLRAHVAATMNASPRALRGPKKVKVEKPPKATHRDQWVGFFKDGLILAWKDGDQSAPAFLLKKAIKYHEGLGREVRWMSREELDFFMKERAAVVGGTVMGEGK